MTAINVSTKLGTGQATAHHAASIYGQPVIVVDGTAYGPAEIGPVQFPPYGEGDADHIEMHAALERAGYEVYA